jgi:hypothetical protein
VISLVQSFALPGGNQSSLFHSLEYLFRRPNFLAKAARGRLRIHCPDGVPMPGHAFIRGRKFSHLLLPGTEIPKLSIWVPKHTVQSSAVVRKLVFVGQVENREFFFEPKTRKPLGSPRVAPMVLRSELVLVPAPAS